MVAARGFRAQCEAASIKLAREAFFWNQFSRKLLSRELMQKSFITGGLSVALLMPAIQACAAPSSAISAFGRNGRSLNFDFEKGTLQDCHFAGENRPRSCGSKPATPRCLSSYQVYLIGQGF